MKFVSTTICGFLTFTVATALRGNNINKNDNKNKNTNEIVVSNARRHLTPGTDCVPFIRVMHYDDGHHEDSWFCEFNEDAVASSGLGNSGSQMIGLDVDEQKMKEKGAISGGCLLTVGRSSYIEPIDVDETNVAQKDNVFGSRSQGKPAHEIFVLHVSAEEDFHIEMMDEDTDMRHSKYHSKRRKLANKTGDLNTLVVRVIDEDNNVAEFSNTEMYNNIFDDPVCLKSQYADCSHDAINIIAAQNPTSSGTQVNGVVDINIDAKISEGRAIMEDEATKKAEATFGGNLNAFDLVMYCQPQTGSDWIAYAYVNSYRSFYNNEWCKSVSVHMHEVGHNLGLHHSGILGGSEYADKTGVMGFSYLVDDAPKMCFNAAKSYQLGWYPDAMQVVDPRSLPGGSQSFTLNGVEDYKTGNGLVSLRLLYTGATIGGKDYYVGYNRVTEGGINELNQAGPNKVHLYQKDSNYSQADGQSTGNSWRMATLDVGENHTWMVGDTEVILTVDNIVDADAYVTLTGGVAPVSPTETPTVSPTETPTVSPTKTPTAAPADPTSTDPPTANPTATPTATPTTNPTATPTAAPIKDVTEPTCSDDSTYRQNGKKHKKCAWLAKAGESKLQKRCDNDGASAREACPVTCRSPCSGLTIPPTEAPVVSPISEDDCEDNDEYRYNGVARKNCAWMKKSSRNSVRKKRCGKKNGEPMIECPIACQHPACVNR